MGHRHIKNLLIATNVNMKGCKAIVFSRGIQTDGRVYLAIPTLLEFR